MDEQPKIIRCYDLFGGAGGFRLGLERANAVGWIQSEADESSGVGQKERSRRHEPRFVFVGYCDFDPKSKTQPQVEIYNRNFKEKWRPTDARRLDPDALPNFDMLCAGFPCQSHSLAGKRAGLKDPRGELFFEITRIAERRKPRLLLLENVKGLLSSEGGKALAKILATLDEVGYDAEWEVLNSKHFGVPQNRERIFIIGHLRGEPFREVFPLGESSEVPAEAQETTQRGRGWLRSVDSNYYKGGARQMIQTLPHGFNDGWMKELPSLGSDAGASYNEFLIYPEIANAVTDGYLMDTSHHSHPMNQYCIRRLTPVECERLQGFPDGWTSGVSDTQRYKMMGNAVTVNIIKAIGRRILESLC